MKPITGPAPDIESGICLDEPDEEVIIAVGKLHDKHHTYVSGSYIDARPMHVCGQCGAVVAYIDKHHAWHLRAS